MVRRSWADLSRFATLGQARDPAGNERIVLNLARRERALVNGEVAFVVSSCQSSIMSACGPCCCPLLGVPIEGVSQRPGQASIGITAERYLHVYSDRE